MLVDTAFTSPNQTGRPRGVRPTSITIHHWGALGQRFDNVVRYLCTKRFDAKGKDISTSAHYVVEAGRVACIVDPDRRAWHAGSSRGNDRSIGIECRPEATDGDYATVAQLVRDLRATYGDLPLVPHSHWKATACPGRWDLDRLDRLARHTPTEDTTTEEDPMVIYRAGKERTSYGVLAHNGGFVELQTKAEYDNLKKAGAREVWVERRTLDNLMADVRSH